MWDIVVCGILLYVGYCCMWDIVVCGILLYVGRDSSVGIWTHTNWTVQESNPGEDEIFLTLPDRPWGPPSLLYSGYRV